MTTQYAEQIDRAMHDAYGPFTPDSEARTIRHENARVGLKTCWHCLNAYRPDWVRGADGKLHHLGRGRWYCSKRCARAARRTEDRHRPVADIRNRDMLVLDLRYCRECPE